MKWKGLGRVQKKGKLSKISIKKPKKPDLSLAFGPEAKEDGHSQYYEIGQPQIYRQ